MKESNNKRRKERREGGSEGERKKTLGNIIVSQIKSMKMAFARQWLKENNQNNYICSHLGDSHFAFLLNLVYGG